MRSGVLAAVVVLALMGAAAALAAFPGRDGRIAFFARTSCPRYAEPEDPCNAMAFSAVLTVSPFGQHTVSVARCPGPTCAQVRPGGPRYSPDGRLIAVIGSLTNPSQVAILRPDGSEVIRIDVPATTLSGVDWLPDGRLVAYAYPEAGGSASRTFVFGADRVAHEVNWRPKGPRTWSARGSVAISHARGIYVWAPASGARRLILPNGKRFAYSLPDWSPDGRRLVVVQDDVLTRLQTIVVVADRGGHRRVVVRAVSSGCTFGGVVWSPSAKRIAYSIRCDDSSTIYTVRADGTDRRELFDIASLTSRDLLEAYMDPRLSWQPLRR